MKGIILAGGNGTRLYPMTKVTNKHLLPVFNEPMIYYPIKTLVNSGITDIMIITGSEHAGDFIELLGTGKDFRGCKFTYRVQEEAGGIAQALSLSENFAGKDKIIVFLGDNIFGDSIKQYVDNFNKQKEGARVLLKEVSDPCRFGIAALDEEERMIIEIEEKPKQPKTNYAVLGVYMYHNDVFDIIKKQKKSYRGEYEISDVNDVYVKKGLMKYDVVDGEWMDAGTFESYQEANRILYMINNVVKK